MAYLPFARPTLDDATIQGVVDVLRSGWLTTGPYVEQFEQALSTYFGGRGVRTFTSATAALEIALRACGIGPGDEVIVPAMTFVATGNVVLRVGATPVLVDVDRRTRNVDADGCRRAVTSRTKAIIPVHFAGLPADLDALLALAHEHRLRLIEDAAHAIGSHSHGRRIGSFGDITCFSFHVNKNITTIEGGAIVTDDTAVLRAATLQRFHGIDKSRNGDVDVLIAGGKANLTDVAARIGLGQLARLDEFVSARRRLVDRYHAQLAGDRRLELPRGGDGHSWHMFAPLLRDHAGVSRPSFIEAMHARGIGVGIHYPALPVFSAYRALGYVPEAFPNAQHIGAQTVTLPLFPAMGGDDVDRVCTAIRNVFDKGAP